MKILSIDVGMKNLAVCLFNITDTLEYEIELWEVLNLCNEPNFICIGKKKNNSEIALDFHRQKFAPQHAFPIRKKYIQRQQYE